MIWLASFPRSGNTFLRNILHDCYGLKSSTYHQEDRPLDTNWDSFPFVKTHLLPGNLPHRAKAVYLLRDGRDAMVSIAWHRTNIVAPGSDYLTNLREAIRAEQGSFFGGWSENVRQWIDSAHVILRFEELIQRPIEVVSRIQAIYDLPQPDWTKLPTFQSQRTGQPEYGSAKYLPKATTVEDFALKNFRRGESGVWKEEVPLELQDLFWERHGEMMERMGYSYDGTASAPHPDLERVAHQKMMTGARPDSRRHVLIEGSKLALPAHDGVKRYVSGLIEGLRSIAEDRESRWQIDVLIDGKAIPLRRVLRKDKREGREDTGPASSESELTVALPESLLLGYEHGLLGFKQKLRNQLSPRVYATFASLYKRLPARPFLRGARKIIQSLRSLGHRLKPPPDPFAVYDLIHLPLQQHFELVAQTRRPIVTTIHDLTYRLYPEYHEGRNVELCEKGIRFALRHRGQLIAVSKATKDDVIRMHRVKSKRIMVTHEATDRKLLVVPTRESFIRLVRQKYGIPPGVPYLLCLSTIEPRKNLDNVVAAFNKLVAQNPAEHLHLVVAGRFGWKTEHLSDLKLPRVVFTGFIEDRHLAVVYSQALALCYVSFYEGFGLPPLEAMTCRTPVIYGNNSSMPEIIGDGGLPAEASDVDDIAEKMERIFRDRDLRENLALNAWRRSFNFSWKRMAAETLAVYEKAIKS